MFKVVSSKSLRNLDSQKVQLLCKALHGIITLLKKCISFPPFPVEVYLSLKQYFPIKCLQILKTIQKFICCTDLPRMVGDKLLVGALTQSAPFWPFWSFQVLAVHSPEL